MIYAMRAEPLMEEIYEKAYFVAGLNSYFRNEYDEDVENAIMNATAFINALPNNVHIPEIHGGTTACSDIILTLNWLSIGKRGMLSLAANFMKDGTCSLSWTKPSGQPATREGLSLEQLLKYPISMMINGLTQAQKTPK